MRGPDAPGRARRASRRRRRGDGELDSDSGPGREPSLYDKYSARGLEILAFPCNQFGAQEPGTAAQIKGFAKVRRDGRGARPRPPRSARSGSRARPRPRPRRPVSRATA